jgi:cyclomaltodextrinase
MRRSQVLLAALLVPLALAGCRKPAAPSASEVAAAPVAVEAPPSAHDGWMRSAVVYGVVPPLYGDPPLQSVTARLDGLAELGVDALWIAPVFETDDPSQISYAVTDYRGLRQDYGSPEDLKALVRGAHARGMKVLLDFIPNHVSTGHPAFVDAKEKGEGSPHHGWFDRDPHGEPTHYFDWEPLKNLNLDHPEVERMVIEGFLHWVREYDVDGFRVDAAWGVRDRSPRFWRKLRAALDAEKEGVFLLAEASARDPFYVRNGLDAAYDWTDKLGEWAWAEAFSDLQQIGPRLAAALKADETPPHRVARFLNNNDTGGRFISAHGPGVARISSTLLHLVPGVAVLFTGDEVGAEYEPYEDPEPLTFEDPHGLRPHFRRLAELRERLPAVRDGRFEVVPVARNGAAFAFARDAGDGPGGRALVVLNFGDAAELSLRPPPEVVALLRGGEVGDALGRPAPPVKLSEDGTVSVKLPARTGVVLTDAASAAAGFSRPER